MWSQETWNVLQNEVVLLSFRHLHGKNMASLGHWLLNSLWTQGAKPADLQAHESVHIVAPYCLFCSSTEVVHKVESVTAIITKIYHIGSGTKQEEITSKLLEEAWKRFLGSVCIRPLRKIHLQWLKWADILGQELAPLDEDLKERRPHKRNSQSVRNT